MSVVTWGVGMMVASKVATKQDWISDDFGKALMVGGALTAAGAFGGEGAIWGEGAAGAEAGVVGESSAMGGGAQTGAYVEPVVDAGTAIEAPSQLAMDSAAAGDLGMTEMIAAEDAGLLSQPIGAGPMTPGAVTPPPGAEKSWLDSKYAMPGMIVGGQMLSGYAAGQSAEELEKKRIEEEKRKEALRTYWGRKRGGGGVDLSLGTGMTEMSSRFFNNPNRQGGLLS